MNFQFESLIEQNVNKQVDKLVGKDAILSTVLKMSLLPEVYAEQQEAILAKIKKK